jgi:hypothetical protein
MLTSAGKPTTRRGFIGSGVAAAALVAGPWAGFAAAQAPRVFRPVT